MVLGTFCFLCCEGIKYNTFVKILQYFLVNTNIYFTGLLFLIYLSFVYEFVRLFFLAPGGIFFAISVIFKRIQIINVIFKEYKIIEIIPFYWQIEVE